MAVVIGNSLVRSVDQIDPEDLEAIRGRMRIDGGENSDPNNLQHVARVAARMRFVPRFTDPSLNQPVPAPTNTTTQAQAPAPTGKPAVIGSQDLRDVTSRLVGQINSGSAARNTSDLADLRRLASRELGINTANIPPDDLVRQVNSQVNVGSINIARAREGLPSVVADDVAAQERIPDSFESARQIIPQPPPQPPPGGEQPQEEPEETLPPQPGDTRVPGGGVSGGNDQGQGNQGGPTGEPVEQPAAPGGDFGSIFNPDGTLNQDFLTQLTDAINNGGQGQPGAGALTPPGPAAPGVGANGNVAQTFSPQINQLAGNVAQLGNDFAASAGDTSGREAAIENNAAQQRDVVARMTGLTGEGGSGRAVRLLGTIGAEVIREKARLEEQVQQERLQGMQVSAEAAGRLREIAESEFNEVIARSGLTGSFEGRQTVAELQRRFQNRMAEAEIFVDPAPVTTTYGEFADAFGSSVGDREYHEDFDLDRNGTIDFSDFTEITERAEISGEPGSPDMVMVYNRPGRITALAAQLGLDERRLGEATRQFNANLAIQQSEFITQTTGMVFDNDGNPIEGQQSLSERKSGDIITLLPDVFVPGLANTTFGQLTGISEPTSATIIGIQNEGQVDAQGNSSARYNIRLENGTLVSQGIPGSAIVRGPLSSVQREAFSEGIRQFNEQMAVSISQFEDQLDLANRGLEAQINASNRSFWGQVMGGVFGAAGRVAASFVPGTVSA